MSFAIETEGLIKIFRSRWSGKEVRAVDGISLRVEPGATFGLLGPNGAGKTTFVKMLLSCAHPTAGRAMVFGRDSREAEARRPIGYLPENHRFPTYMTGRSMLDFYGALSGMESAARRKRVGLAQALMHAPSLLILDEPSDGVDPIGRRQIRDILHALEQQGVTIFLNSHLLAEVELFCHDVAIIHRGKVALEGKVKDLTAGSGYRVEAERVPERVEQELRAKAMAVAQRNGNVEFLFGSRDEANQAVDLLRAEHCEIESVARTSSTLEDVFVKAIHEQ
jgi:ABC-2 type transport system ATP-binding protein